MDMCSDGHIEIVWDNGHKKKCPLCQVISELKEVEENIESLQNELHDKQLQTPFEGDK